MIITSAGTRKRERERGKQLKNGNPSNCNLKTTSVMRRTHAAHDNHDMSHVMARLPYLPPVSIPPKGRGLFHLELCHFEHVASRSEHGTDTGPWYFMVLECFGNVWQCNYVVFFVKLHVGILSSLVLHAFMAMACVCYRLSAYLVAGAFTPSQSETQCRHLGPASSCTHFTLTQYACSVCKPSSLVTSALSCFWKASTPMFRLSPHPSSPFPKREYLEGSMFGQLLSVFPQFKCAVVTLLLSKRTLKLTWATQLCHPLTGAGDWSLLSLFFLWLASTSQVHLTHIITGTIRTVFGCI